MRQDDVVCRAQLGSKRAVAAVEMNLDRYMLVLAAALTVAASPAPAPSPSASVQPIAAPAPVHATLANGMNVVILPNALAPVATTIMMYGVGSDDDTMPGLAHATEHMLFRGTTDLSAGQLSDIAARMGAAYDAQTSNEWTLYWFKLPAAYVDVALHIEADRMSNAKIDASDWATERGAIEQEIQAQASQPGYKIGTKVNSVFFAGTPFANPTGGTVASFEKMQAGDIKTFYRAWYHPSNATLVVAGDVDPAKTLALVHADFDGIAPGTMPAHAPVRVPPLPSTVIRDTIDFPLGFGAYAYRLPGSTSPDYAPAIVLNDVFDSGRGAFADLQAQGKVLGALSFSSSFPETGVTFFVAIPAQGGDAQDALTQVGGVIDAYRTNGVPADLIAASKARLLAQRAFEQASISGLAFSWGNSLAQHQPTPDSVYDAIAAVTPADVQRVLDTYFVADHQVTLVLDGKPDATFARPDPNAGVENVSYQPTKEEPLPAWAAVALKTPLGAPADDTKIVTRTLPNGLRLRVRQESAAPVVVLSGVIRNDPQLYDPPGKDGVAMMVDELLPWGTTTYDRKGYQEQLDAAAADVTLGTSFGLEVQSLDFDRGVQLLADGMLHPRFDPSSFAVVKSQTLESVNATNALPSEKADLAQRLALYPKGDPRRRDVDGTTVGAIQLADVRKYYDFAYRPDLTEIAVVGDVTPDEAQAVVEKYFGGWKASGPTPSFRYPTIKQPPAKATSVTVKSETNVQSQVTLKEVLHLRSTDADYVALQLANTILSGEGTGSILFQELRTRHGYVYGVDSDLSSQPEGAEFTISYASQPRDVDPAEAAALAVIRRLQREPLPSVELQRAKASLLAKKVLPLDSYDGVASDMLAGAAEGITGDVSDRWFWRSLLAITPSDLERAMRQIDTTRFVRVVVAPGS